jgi:hypothetical protein
MTSKDPIAYKKALAKLDPEDEQDAAVLRLLANNSVALSYLAKHTDTGKALKAWCVETAAACLPKPEPVADTSFASEAMDEPNDNTRMVT